MQVKGLECITFKAYQDTILNPLRKKRIRVDTMLNSLLRGIIGFWSKYHALRPTNSEYLDMIVALCILFTLFEYD